MKVLSNEKYIVRDANEGCVIDNPKAACIGYEKKRCREIHKYGCGRRDIFNGLETLGAVK